MRIMCADGRTVGFDHFESACSRDGPRFADRGGHASTARRVYFSIQHTSPIIAARGDLASTSGAVADNPA